MILVYSGSSGFELEDFNIQTNNEEKNFKQINWENFTRILKNNRRNDRKLSFCLDYSEFFLFSFSLFYFFIFMLTSHFFMFLG